MRDLNIVKTFMKLVVTSDMEDQASETMNNESGSESGFKVPDSEMESEIDELYFDTIKSMKRRS